MKWILRIGCESALYIKIPLTIEIFYCNIPSIILSTVCYKYFYLNFLCLIFFAKLYFSKNKYVFQGKDLPKYCNKRCWSLSPFHVCKLRCNHKGYYLEHIRVVVVCSWDVRVNFISQNVWVYALFYCNSKHWHLQLHTDVWLVIDEN